MEQTHDNLPRSLPVAKKKKRHKTKSNKEPMAQVAIVDTPVQDIAGKIEAAAAKADVWKQIPVKDKVSLLKQIKSNLIKYIDEWASAVSQS